MFIGYLKDFHLKKLGSRQALAHQLRGRLTAQRLALQRTEKLAKAVQQRLDALRGARYAPGFT